jgi:hypothetical protein
MFSILLVFVCSVSFAQTDTWLPARYNGEVANPATTKIIEFLRSLNGSLRFITCTYQVSKLVQTNVFASDTLSVAASK